MHFLKMQAVLSKYSITNTLKSTICLFGFGKVFPNHQQIEERYRGAVSKINKIKKGRHETGQKRLEMLTVSETERQLLTALSLLLFLCMSENFQNKRFYIMAENGF